MPTSLILTDIHGCFDEMTSLIDRANADQVYICGDLIDRGPDSRKVVQYAIDNDIPCILGNHELMAIETIDSYNPGLPYSNFYLQGSDWFANGGRPVFDSYDSLDDLRTHIEFFKSLPIYRTLDHTRNGKPIVLSHSNLSSYIRTNLAPIGPSYNDLGLDSCVPIVWNRSSHFLPDTPYYNIFGHTPTDIHHSLVRKPHISDSYANLDTGCAYKSIPSRGVLTGLLLPSFEVIQS